MSEKFDSVLLDSGDFMRRASLVLINNSSRAVAIITLIVASLITFTDLSFGGIEARSFTASALIMLLASYLIYFSMSDAGEKAAEGSLEYKTALKQYSEARDAVRADKISELRAFCRDYSRDELNFRRENMLICYSEDQKEFEQFLVGKRDFDKRKLRIFKKAARLSPVQISPHALLSRESISTRSELRNPSCMKVLRLFVKLIPTTVCMLLTVSIIPSVKDSLGTEEILEGIIKLSSLPIIGFRGYSTGFFYTHKEKIPWIETKTRLIRAFLNSAEI